MPHWCFGWSKDNIPELLKIKNEIQNDFGVEKLDIDSSIKDFEKQYIEKISSTNKSIFLSINQEADNFNAVDGNQSSVNSLLSSNKNFKLINRSRDFLRQGYIEELYSLI